MNPKNINKRTVGKISVICLIVLTISLVIPAYEYRQPIYISQPNPIQTQTGTVDKYNFTQPVGIIASMTVSIHIAVHNFADLFANKTMLEQGFTANCLYLCYYGITYVMDPTVVFTNYGHDFLQYKFTGACNTITCTSTDNMNYYIISTSSTTPLVTDTGCGGGSGAGQITSGGLYTSSAITITSGTASAGSVTYTYSHTYTAAETDTNTQMICVQTENASGGNIVLGFEGTYGPDTLHSGDTITPYFQVTMT
jgi:hypothetical protein